MSFDKKLQKAVNDIEIPEELSPANIEAMLRKMAPVQDRNTENTAVEVRSRNITASRTNRAVIMRTLAAAAACLALVGGFAAFHDKTTSPEPIESEIEYEAVQVQTYDELYSIYTGIYLKNSNEAVGAENGDGVEIKTDETAITDLTEPVPEATQPPVSEAAAETEIEPATTETVRSDFSDADIVKSDDKSIYYLCAGTLYAVDKENMTVTAVITPENAPFEMYVRGNSLVLISEENASDSSANTEKNVAADIYDTSSGIPEHIKTYKQNGTYISARVDESGVLFLVTGYSDYRVTPLDENAELENYVPGYYIDGVKHYVAAGDISVPRDANNTDYTVVSYVDCTAPENITVKAVLGSSKNSYCSETTLYVAGTGFKDGKDYTTVTAFDITGDTLKYKASAVLKGELISRSSMAESGGFFRIACRTFDENGMVVTNIYTLGEDLTVASTAENLLPGVIVGSVKYNDNYANLTKKGDDAPMQSVDLGQSTLVDSMGGDLLAAYVNKFGNGLVGISAVKDNEGKLTALKLQMYSNDGGNLLNEFVFAEITDVDSPALTDKNAMFVDEENNIIGIPVSGKTEFGVINRYYILSYSEDKGFEQKGVIEYNDIAESYRFERAVVNDGVLIIIGSGRIVTVNLEDMTVIETVDFK